MIVTEAVLHVRLVEQDAAGTLTPLPVARLARHLADLQVDWDVLAQALQLDLLEPAEVLVDGVRVAVAERSV